MKKNLLFLLLCLPFMVFAQDNGNSDSDDVDITEIHSAEDADALIDDPFPFDKPEPQSDGKDQEIIDVFAGTRDKYNVPVGLYRIDSKLYYLKNKYENAKTTQNIMGISCLIVIPAGIAIGYYVPELVWAPFNIMTPIPWGYVIAAIAAGVGIYDIFVAIPETARSKKEFNNYFEESYGMY